MHIDIQDSYARCKSSKMEFGHAFWEKFTQDSRVAAQFPRGYEKVDPTRKVEVLMAALEAVTTLQDSGSSLRRVRWIAAKHKKRGIPSVLYSHWADAVLAAVMHVEQLHEERVCRAWADQLALVVEHILAEYGEVVRPKLATSSLVDLRYPAQA
jgi:hypothetical protein